MQLIRLRQKTWKYDPNELLGPPGGFGSVFLGRDEDDNEVAVKRLHISSESAGHRELKIAEEIEGRDLKYIIPIYDSGIDAESGQYFIVMAKAEMSLQDVVKKGPLGEKDAVKVILQIAHGIEEVSDIVHRDLKPGNVLFHEGSWKLTDFGIARFIQDATSMNTLKGCWTPEYAAPEQWRLERATTATDIYALGCIIFTLVAGHPPFTSGDFQQQHLHEEPPQVKASPRMQQLISLCLRKSPQARSPIKSILNQLASLTTEPVVSSVVADVGAEIAEQEAKKEAEGMRRRTELKKRQQLAEDALKILSYLLDTLFQSIVDSAPVAHRLPNNQGVTLGSGTLTVDVVFPLLRVDAFPEWKKNIICGAVITVEQTFARYRGRSANLWYGEIGASGEFRWWEIPYFSMKNVVEDHDPYAIRTDPEIQNADYAGSPIMHIVQQAARPRPIDGEYRDDFINRWSTRLAAAAKNALHRPPSLPERLPMV